MKFLCTAFLLGLLGVLQAQSDPQEKTIPSKIERVTVFLQGAQVIRKAETTLSPGKSVLVIKGLSPQMDPASLKTTATGKFTLLSVNHRRNYNEQREKTARVTALEQTIALTQDTVNLVKAHLQVLDQEAAFLQANQSIGGKDKAYALEELKSISAFYAARLRQIQEEKLGLTKRAQDLEKRIRQQQNQLREFQQAQAQVSGEVVLTVEAEAATKAVFELSYLANNCGWFPNYDLKVRSIAEPIALSYKAGVYQNTGEDWNNVRLRFSNGTPNESSTVPVLPPYYLPPVPPPYSYQRPAGIYNPNVRQVTGKITDENGEPLVGANILVRGTALGAVTDLDGNYSLLIPQGAQTLQVSYTGFEVQDMMISSERMDVRLNQSRELLSEVVVTGYAIRGKASGVDLSKERIKEEAALAPPSATLETATTVEFELQIPFTVPSDGEKYTVELANVNLKASYEYQAVPKLEKTAYLTAYVTDWEQYNLLEGEANLFFEDTYLGRSLLDTRLVSDTLKLSLGRDRGVSVDRQTVREFTRRGFAGGKNTDTRTYRIAVRNAKAQPIKIVVYDQIPVSRNKEIEVTPVQLSGGELRSETGQVTWTLQLAPGEQKELLLQYEVRYPKGMNLKVE
ncbi:MAG: mucoidy inhibitor MuiA family protein [Haliscomenobacter sp.]|nr:mucoidy inhibitor MuiA family protein [Haliscomenobacter sp.]